MVSADKFYIYGGGRWREVDPGSGRIDGWGHAKFLVARGGKLQATRSRPVLAALRALAAGEPSAAREGPDLPCKYPAQRRDSKTTKRAGCSHCQCSHNKGTNFPSNIKDKANVAVQCENYEASQKTAVKQTTRSNIPQANKRKRDSSSSDNVFHTEITTVATVHSSKKPERKRRRMSSDSKIHRNISSNRKVSSSEDSQAIRTTKKPQKSPSLKLRRPGPLKRKRKSSSIDSSTTAKTSEEIGQNKIPSFKKNLKYESTSDEIAPIQRRHSQRLVISSDDSDFQTSSKSPTKHKIGPKKSLERSCKDKQIKHKIGPKKATVTDNQNKHIGPKKVPKFTKNKQIEKERASINARQWLCKRVEAVSRTQETETQCNTQEAFRELVIDERDIEILRLFLQNHFSDEELLKFDTDDNHKKMHFYRINPLVNLERCPRIAKMIQADLVDFASKLGLKSISETSSITARRSRRRANTSINNRQVDRESIDAENKENIDRPAPSRKNLQAKESVKSKGKDKKQDNGIQESNNKREEMLKGDKRSDKKRDIDNTVDTIELNSESELDTPPKPALESKIKKPQSRGRFVNVYSDLEDHAIVSWVSVGGRASQVNGNRLWRELQDQFARITHGQDRTWHSLRNRYLRYILPRLGSLALPPAQQARLRAAAATGEIKSRKKEPRRNSIFTLPPRGASSRRPGALAGRAGTPSETEPPDIRNTDKDASPPPERRAPSPRYSDVTRQFARRHRAQQNSSERSHGSSEARRKSKRIQSPTVRRKDPSERASTSLSPSKQRSNETKTRSSLQMKRRSKKSPSPASPSKNSEIKSRNSLQTRQRSRKSPSPTGRKTKSISSSGSDKSLLIKRNNLVSKNTRTSQTAKSSRNSTDSWVSSSGSDTSDSPETHTRQSTRLSERFNSQDRLESKELSLRSKRPRSPDLGVALTKRRTLETKSPKSGLSEARPRLLRSDKKSRKLFNPQHVM